MADEESGTASENVGLREHLDNPLVFLVVVAFFVFGLGAGGRALGNRINAPGVTAFFGG